MDNDTKAGKSSPAAPRRYVLTLEYDADTHQVSIGGDPMPLSLGQMICDEGLRVLGEKRRIAAAMGVRDAMRAQAQGSALVDKLFKQ